MMKAESVGVMGHKHDEIVEELPVFKITMSLDNVVDCLKNAINDTVRGVFGNMYDDIKVDNVDVPVYLRYKMASVYESLDRAKKSVNEVLHNTNLCEKDENKSPIITLNLNGDDIHGMIIENFNPIVK